MKIIGTKVGKTNITSTYIDNTGSSDTKEFTVTAVSLASISKPENNVYTGSAWEPQPTVTAMVGGVSTILNYGTDYTLSYSNNTNVGTATVTATGIGNFTGTVQNTWNITGATITVIANDQSYTYDGSMHGYEITVETVNNQEATIKYRYASSGSYTITTTPQFKDVVNSGYDNIVYFQVTAPNHVTFEGSYHLEIYPKVVTLQWGDTNWTYDGTTHSTTCVVTNLVAGDTCTVTLTGNSITNIGSTTVTATSLSNTNYTLTGASNTSVILTVAAGLFIKLSGSWTPVRKVYKKVGTSWTLQALDVAFDTSQAYVKIN